MGERNGNDDPGAARPRTAPPCAFVIFGATGDLTARKLMPALYRLHLAGLLHEETVIVGYARSDLGDAALRQRLEEAVREEAPEFEPEAWRELAARIRYVRGAYDEVDDFRRLAEVVSGLDVSSRVFYTATPPSVYEAIADCLGEAGLARPPADGFTRLVVEKPFGYDLASAKELNAALLARFDESQLFRIDHYLAKETAQNIAVLRFANTIFEPLWNGNFVDHVQISVLEPLGMEGRGSFYESAGVIRDVFQNHLLQLMAVVGMEPPARFDAHGVRDEKVKFFDAVSCPDPGEVVLGQYVAGNGHAGYRQEEEVDPGSRQATFAALRLEVANWRWAGVPFYLRSGKRLEGKASEIVLQFKNPPHVPFDLKAPLPADRLVLRIAPDEGIELRFNGKRPGQRIELNRISLEFGYERTYDAPNPDAYETLLLDVMEGDATLFMRADEVEAQWRIVEPILESERPHGPEFYEAGGRGPDEAFALLAKSGREWVRPAGLEGAGR